jgi:hypothetical protein
VHPDIVIELARQHVADELDRARRPVFSGADPGATTPRRRPSLRTRLGWALVRWGHRLAPPPAAVRRAPRRAATMGS